jgi:hypothetical protein
LPTSNGSLKDDQEMEEEPKLFHHLVKEKVIRDCIPPAKSF